MASLTRANIVARALEALGVKAAGQAASAEDSAKAGEAVDETHSQLIQNGLAPFAISAVPDWAQSALIHIAAEKLIPSFGVVGEARANVLLAAQRGRSELIDQLAEPHSQTPTQAEYF